MSIQRQLRDIIQHGQTFKNTDLITVESVNAFNLYAEEIKKHLIKHSKNDLVLERAAKIKPVVFKEERKTFWFYLVVIVSLFLYNIYHLYSAYNARINCKNQILEIVSIFASIEFLLKNE